MIEQIIPRATKIKSGLALCDVCKSKCLLSEGKIETDPQDRELIFVCDECRNSAKYPAWIYMRLQGEI